MSFSFQNSKEYLMVSRDGGYSSSTLCGQNIRTYHGLLVYPNHDFSDRIVTLAKFEEIIHFQDQTFELSTNQFNDVIHPRGFEMIEKIEVESFPAQLTTQYRWGDHFFFQKIQKQVEGQNELELIYLNQSKEPLTLTLRPLMAFRSYHHSQSSAQTITSYYSKSKKQIEIKSDHYSFFVQISSDQNFKYGAEEMVYRDMIYSVDQARGLGHRENLNSPCDFTFELSPKEKVKIIVRVIDKNKLTTTKNIFKFTEADSKIIAKFPGAFSLVSHAQDFVVRHNQKLKLLAGYHWFTDWGRDTLIAMRGLILATGRFGEAKELLENLLSNVHQGLIYNVYVEGSGAGSGYQYHSADASLLLFVALYDYVLGTNDLDFFSKHQKTLKSILDHFVKGTLNDIYFSDQKLLHAGNNSTALSWMDAKVDGKPVTSRSPYAIDLNALFYNAMCTYDEFCRQTKFPTAYEKLTQELFLSFKKYFWNGQFGVDYLDENYHANQQFRPNQLYALALPYPLFNREQGKQILERVEKELMTPVGLRTLSPADLNYIGSYEGGPAERDRAYHQGTVWPYLLGIYGDAIEYVYGKTNLKWKQFKEQILSFLNTIDKENYGLVPEIYSANAPHLAKGCIHQAWSSGEIIRLLVKF
jgi:predicted glycogen debranching enzyme